MILSALRIIVAALEDPTIGVNAQILALPLDGNDGRPSRIKYVRETTLDSDIVFGRLPADWPGLIVTADGATTIEGEIRNGVYQEGVGMAVAIRYATRDPDAAQANRNGLYTLTAIRRTINELFDTANQADRLRNGIYLISCREMIEGPLFEERETGTITAALVAEFVARDTAPVAT